LNPSNPPLVFPPCQICAPRRPETTGVLSEGGQARVHTRSCVSGTRHRRDVAGWLSLSRLWVHNKHRAKGMTWTVPICACAHTCVFACAPLLCFACLCRGLFCLRVSRNVPEAMELRADELDAELHAVEAHPRFREAMHEYMAFQNAMIPSCTGAVSPDHGCVNRLACVNMPAIIFRMTVHVSVSIACFRVCTLTGCTHGCAQRMR